MADDGTPTANADEARAAKRRSFLKSAAKVAVTAPAVTLILSAGTMKKATAGSICAPVK